MNKNQKRSLLIIGSLFFLLLFVYVMNDSFYNSYRHKINFEVINLEKGIIPGTDKEYIENHIQKQLERSGFKEVVVDLKKEILYGEENLIYIEGKPILSPLDTLLKRKIEPISIEAKFINKKRYTSKL